MKETPTRFSSSSASANNLRILASDSPTYLSKICGPLTILGSRAFNILPICLYVHKLNKEQIKIIGFLMEQRLARFIHLAIRVLPVPGGPNNKIPRTCFMSSCCMISGGKTREANARLNMVLNSLSRPPMPILVKSQSGLIIDWCCVFLRVSFKFTVV